MDIENQPSQPFVDVFFPTKNEDCQYIQVCFPEDTNIIKHRI